MIVLKQESAKPLITLDSWYKVRKKDKVEIDHRFSSNIFVYKKKKGRGLREDAQIGPHGAEKHQRKVFVVGGIK